MKTYFASRIIAIGCLLGTAVLTVAVPARAAEDVATFLGALRDQGYHEVALDYLDKMANSPLAPDTFKEIVLYEKGVTIVAASRVQRDAGVREKQLDQAQAIFKKFVTEQATHPKVSDANTQLANLLVERARLKLNQANNKNKDAKQQAAFRSEARALYTEARKVFTATAESLKVELEGIPKVLPEAQAALIARRRQLRADYLQAQVLKSAILEEMADVEEEGSKAYKDKLIEAAAEYKIIYEKYRSRLAGLYARMYQGRCYVKIKDYKEALSYLSDLLQQPDDAALRQLRTKTLVLAAECWLNDSQPKYAAAIKEIEPFVDSANPVEETSRDFLSLMISLAKAQLLRAADEKKDNPKSADARRARESAVKLLTFVAKYPGEFQKEAEILLRDLPGTVATKGGKPDPKTFAEAKTVGKESLDALQAATNAEPEFKAKIGTAKDQTARAEMQKQYDENLAKITTSRDDAMTYYRLALQLADDETPSEDVNVVQYYLCYLYYIQGNYYDSAVLGELVARRYSQSNGARSCAHIAMASYQTLYGDEVKRIRAEAEANPEAPAVAANQPIAEFEFNRLVGIAEYIVQRWPEQSQAVQARNLLISLMLSIKELDKALSYLNDIPTDSIHRGQAELDTGLAIWNAYLGKLGPIRVLEDQARTLENKVANLEKTSPEDASLSDLKSQLKALRDEVTPLRQEADPLKDLAENTLFNGVTRMQETGAVDKTMASASLSLAQIYVDTAQSDKAIALLENPKFGALTLVKQGDPAAESSVFVQETYKAALQSYMLSLATSKDSDATIAKTKAIMDAMIASAGNNADDKRRLVATFSSLAGSLDEKIKDASPSEKANLLKGFDTFLRQVGNETTEFSSLGWVAGTFARLGNSVDSGEGKLSDQAKDFFGQSIKFYEKILDASKKGSLKIDSTQQLQIRMKLAMVSSSSRKYNDAMGSFQTILKNPQNNRMLNVQIEAAKAYTNWGINYPKKFPTKGRNLFDYAVYGGRFDKKTRENTIWGWVKIARMSAQAMGRYDKKKKEDLAKWNSFNTTFHLARYNVAYCHYQLALRKGKEGSRDDRKKYLELAKQDIQKIYVRYKDLGGSAQKQEYDSLMKDIQKNLGERQTGLVALQTSPKK